MLKKLLIPTTLSVIVIALVVFIAFDMNTDSEIVQIEETGIRVIDVSAQIEKHDADLEAGILPMSEEDILLVELKSQGRSDEDIEKYLIFYDPPEYDETSLVIPDDLLLRHFIHHDKMFEDVTYKTLDYDYLSNLFGDDYSEIVIYNMEIKHDYYEPSFPLKLSGLTDVTEEEINEARIEIIKWVDEGDETATIIFLSKYSIDDDMYRNEFFYRDGGIQINISPKEELSEIEIKSMGTSKYDTPLNVNLSNNLQAGLASLDDKDWQGILNKKSSLWFIDNENSVSISSTLNDDQLMRLGLLLSTENPFR